MDIWITAQELTELPNAEMPRTAQGVAYKAKVENWERRRVAGVKGRAYEYNILSLPPLAQAAYLKKNGKILVGNSVMDIPKREPKEKNYCAEALWANYDRATTKQKEKAQLRVHVVLAVEELVANKVDVLTAFETVAKTFDVKWVSVRGWFYQVKGFDRSDYLPVLLSKCANRTEPTRQAEFDEQAWEFFKADYLRPAKPAFKTSYYLMCDVAKEKGWIVPSDKTVKRKLDKEVPMREQVLLRDGEHAVMRMFPAQQRSVADIEALEWINGDGYLHNVFVKWTNGDIIRPKTWLWQDARTRKILAWRCDVSENTDSIRLSLADLVHKYGIPKHMVIDNTTAAANKAMTGGQEHRYRNKFKEGEAVGIIQLLGIKLHWTSINFGKGHGQAKPIERVFSHGGLGELVDKDPSLAGYYTGPNAMEKPDDYDHKKGAPYDVFIKALERGIARYNAKPNRNTEICAGKLSFDEAFAEDYPKSTVKKASLEQYRLLMLVSETVTLRKDGTFELNAGKLQSESSTLKNRYYSEELIASRINKIVARFDPQNLHEKVLAYTLDGRFLCEAQCLTKTGFGDTQTGREHGRQRTQFVKNTKKAAQNQLNMSILEAASYLPETTPEESSANKPYSLSDLTKAVVNGHGGYNTHESEKELEAFNEMKESLFEKGMGNLIRQKKEQE